MPHRSGAWRSLPPSRRSIIRKPIMFQERFFQFQPSLPLLSLSDTNSSCTISTHLNSGAGPRKVLLDVRTPSTFRLARRSIYQAELDFFFTPPTQRRRRRRRRQRPQDSSGFSSPQVVPSCYRSSSAQRNSPFLANGRTRTSRRTSNESRSS